MGFTIAVAGKGGTGKTTVAALLIHSLLKRGDGPVLAVDADPNANLGESLGLEVGKTIGELQAETLRTVHNLPAGVPLNRHLEYELHQAIAEGEGVDLLVMGRGEGPGCYCAINHILRRYLETLRTSYRYTVLDNEAGMEHLSRRVSHGIDLLLVVSDAGPVALRAAGRIARLADELELEIGQRYLVLNNLRGELTPLAEDEAKKTGLKVIGRIPFDETIFEGNLAGRPMREQPSETSAFGRIDDILETLLEKEEVT
jgi:CO dehydrogenase maturation factor